MKIRQNVSIIFILFISKSLSEILEEPLRFRRGQHVDCVYADIGVFVCDGYSFENTVIEADVLGSADWWFHLGTCILLLIVAAISFGLNMGLMSLDVLKVRLLKRSNLSGHEYAVVVYELIKRHHLLLVTLLLAFVAALETIPLFLSKLVPNAFYSLAISVPAVLIFGLILPGAICTRYSLQCGYYFSWFVWLLIVLLGIIAWPVAKLLDLSIGEDDRTIFKRPELKELVHLYTTDVEETAYGSDDGEIHEEHDDNDSDHDDPSHRIRRDTAKLTGDEVKIIIGALNMKEKSVRDAMIDLNEVYMLNDDAVFDERLMNEIAEQAHSRIPVYHGKRDLIVGMLMTAQLVRINPEDKVPLEDLEVLQVPRVTADMNLYRILDQFKSGKSQMAIVLDEYDYLTPIGVITLEDIFEILIADQIYDEHDYKRMNKPRQHYNEDDYNDDNNDNTSNNNINNNSSKDNVSGKTTASASSSGTKISVFPKVTFPSTVTATTTPTSDTIATVTIPVPTTTSPKASGAPKSVADRKRRRGTDDSNDESSNLKRFLVSSLQRHEPVVFAHPDDRKHVQIHSQTHRPRPSPFPHSKSTLDPSSRDSEFLGIPKPKRNSLDTGNAASISARNLPKTILQSSNNANESINNADENFPKSIPISGRSVDYLWDSTRQSTYAGHRTTSYDSYDV